DQWVVCLVTYLTGKAQLAYGNLDLAETTNYDHVKRTILRRYDSCGEMYHQRFCTLQYKNGDQPRDIYICLKDLFYKWTQPERKMVHELAEEMIMEQFLQVLPEDVQVWVREHTPESEERAIALAEDYQLARRTNIKKD
uniref:SCAN box domain-containing protein n=1 Tax=Latimeria chalumnae TaxID=7897 RepID=H3APM0_LATCH